MLVFIHASDSFLINRLVLLQLNYILFYEYRTICSCGHQLMYIWVFSRFWQLHIKLLWKFVNVFGGTVVWTQSFLLPGQKSTTMPPALVDIFIWTYAYICLGGIPRNVIASGWIPNVVRNRKTIFHNSCIIFIILHFG